MWAAQSWRVYELQESNDLSNPRSPSNHHLSNRSLVIFWTFSLLHSLVFSFTIGRTALKLDPSSGNWCDKWQCSQSTIAGSSLQIRQVKKHQLSSQFKIGCFLPVPSYWENAKIVPGSQTFTKVCTVAENWMVWLRTTDYINLTQTDFRTAGTGFMYVCMYALTKPTACIWDKAFTVTASRM